MSQCFTAAFQCFLMQKPIPSCQTLENNESNVGVENKLQHLVMLTVTSKADMSRLVISMVWTIWWNNVYWLCGSAKGCSFRCCTKFNITCSCLCIYSIYILLVLWFCSSISFVDKSCSSFFLLVNISAVYTSLQSVRQNLGYKKKKTMQFETLLQIDVNMTDFPLHRGLCVRKARSWYFCQIALDIQCIRTNQIFSLNTRQYGGRGSTNTAKASS